MNISSYSQALTSFNRQDFLKMCRSSLVDALPVAPLVNSLFNLAFQCHPQLFRNEDIADADAEDFILTDSKEHTAQVIDLYMQRRVNIDAPSEELKTSTQANVKSSMIDSCHRRMQQIEKIAADFGIKKVAFGISISRDPPECGAQEAPYQAIGNRYSYLSAPMIVATPPQIKLNVDPSISVTTEKLTEQQTAVEKGKNFIVAHEMVHIAKNHALISTISYAAFSALATGVWALGLYSGVSVSSALCTYALVVGISLPFQVFYNTQRRCQEKEADLEAMKYLGSNEGAIAANEGFEKLGVVDDLEHPPFQERKAYVLAEKFS